MSEGMEFRIGQTWFTDNARRKDGTFCEASVHIKDLYYADLIMGFTVVFEIVYTHDGVSREELAFGELPEQLKEKGWRLLP